MRRKFSRDINPLCSFLRGQESLRLESGEERDKGESTLLDLCSRRRVSGRALGVVRDWGKEGGIERRRKRNRRE